MKGKAGIVVFCLIFAVCFGGGGALTGWMMGTMIYDGVRAKDWVKVKADVESATSYRYTFQGREYRSTRLGIERLGGSDNLDDWHQAMAEHMTAALADKKPITVFVNPEEPREAVVDREIRWKLLLFLVPFTLGFGGVGVGALGFLAYSLLKKPDTSPGQGKRRLAAATSGSGGLLGFWGFALLWNVISIPVAILVVPDAVRDGEWAALLVLLFPLVGLLMLWGAAAATIGQVRRRGATFALSTARPRAGAPLEGTVTFPHGVREGEAMRVTLTCMRTTVRGANTRIESVWAREVDSRAQSSGASPWIAFRFDVPADVPASSPEDDSSNVTHRWKLATRAPGATMAAAGYDIELAPAELGDQAITFDAEQPAEPDPAALKAVEALTGRSAEKLSSRQRDALASMTPEQGAAIAKVAKCFEGAKLATGGVALRKFVIGLVALVFALEYLPGIMSFLRRSLAD